MENQIVKDQEQIVFKNDYCIIIKTKDNKLIRKDLILKTQMYINSYFDENGNFIRV